MSTYGNDGPCTLAEAQEDDSDRHVPRAALADPAPVVQHDDATDGEGA